MHLSRSSKKENNENKKDGVIKLTPTEVKNKTRHAMNEKFSLTLVNRI